MTTEIIKSEDYGIQKKQAKELLGDLPQIKAERAEMEKQYAQVVKLDLEDPESSKKAKELRMLIKNNRTKGINVWHKNAKDYFLKGGQFVDAIKRKEVAINERMEDKLLEIEKYAEIKEQERKEKLKTDRIKKLQPFEEFVSLGIEFGELSEEDFQKLYNGAKLQFESEQKRIEEERKEQERKDRVRKLHNERKEELLNVWDFVENPQINFGELNAEDFDQIKVNAESSKQDYLKQQEEIRLENELLKKEREEAERLAKIEADKRAKQQAAERKKQAEIQARLDAEIKAKKQREEAEKEAVLAAKKESERLAKLPIKEKMNNWVKSFELPECPEDNEVSKNILVKFNNFKKWANEQIKDF